MIADRFDSPVGTPEERASSKIWPGRWTSSNPYANHYYLGPGKTNPAYHTGDDLGLPADADAHAALYAVGNGTVIYARHVTNSTWGNLIVLGHTLPDGAKVYSRYGHVENMQVKVGDQVQRGQRIASVGNAFGRFAYHLHFDIGTTDRLRLSPVDWPGLDRARLLRDYVDPRTWLEEHRDMTDIPVEEPPKGITLVAGKTKEAVNFRRWYQVAASTLIKALPKGAALTAYRGITAVDARGQYTWQFCQHDGVYGWIADTFIEIQPDPVPPPVVEPPPVVVLPPAEEPPPVVIPPPVEVPPAVSIGRKIGLHCAWNTDSSLIVTMARRLFEANKPLACVVVNSNAELANELAAYTTVLFRQVWDGNERYNVKMLDGLTDAQAFEAGYDFYFGAHYPRTKSANKAHYHKLVNECGFHPLDWSFWLGAMTAANTENVKLALFGDSVGTPEIEQWKQRERALRFAVQHGHIVTLNQYGRFDYVDGQYREANYPVSDNLDYQWFGGRHEQFYGAVPEDCRPLLVIGEAGPSNSRVTYPQEFVIADMQRYSYKLNNGKYADKVLGFAYWTLGRWENSSLDWYIEAIERAVVESWRK